MLSRCLTLEGLFGNPASSTHRYGRRAAAAIETARTQAAALFKVDPREIIWTSGATEANNLALRGVVRARRNQGCHIITSKTEHKAVLDVCRSLEREGCAVSYLDVHSDGLIDFEGLTEALRPDTALVSLMHVNNETGVVQPLVAVSELTQSRGILLHVDAAQSAGKIPLDLSRLPIDLLSFSAHKLYGPKGVGALFVRQRPNRIRLEPLLYGGGQERGLRGGTLPIHQIVAFGEACRIALDEMTEEHSRVQSLRNRLWQGLVQLGDVVLNGHPQHHAPGILNVSFAGVTAEALITAIPTIAVSTGSACTSASDTPSHVLRAMGGDLSLARGAIRFSLGRYTTVEEIDYTLQAIGLALYRLRSLSPFWINGRFTPASEVDWAAPA